MQDEKNCTLNNIKEEIEILRRLTCKYIVRIFELIETPKFIYRVIEYFPKNSILENVENIDLDSAWKYFRNLISAIQFCNKTL